MELPLQITAHGFSLSPAEEKAIRAAAAKLGEFAPRIMSCRVAIEIPKDRGRSGRQYRVHVDLGVPGREIIVRRRSGEALQSAVQKAFKAVGRRLQDHVRRQRKEVKRHRRSKASTVAAVRP